VKTCTKCNAEKQKTEFYNKSSSKDGLCTECKSCSAARSLEYRSKNKEKASIANKDYYISNREKIAAVAKEYRIKNKDKLSESQRNYNFVNSSKISANKGAKYAESSSQIKAMNRAYYAANRDKIAEQKKEYRSANQDKIIAHNRNARARRRDADGRHTALEVALIFSLQRGLCASCHAALLKSGPRRYHVDHIMPLALGGSNDKGNLQCLCQICNLSKNSKDPTVWANENGRLL